MKIRTQKGTIILTTTHITNMGEGVLYGFSTGP